MPGRTRASALAIVARWVLLLWVIFAVDVGLRVVGIDLVQWGGLWPREPRGLIGVLTCHVLHADLWHLLSNSIALLVLGTVACWYSRRLTALAALSSALIAGLFTWLIARPGLPHVGASGIVFGLVGFLVANGLFRRSWGAILLALPFAVLLSGLIPGMLPSASNRAQMISWQMHLGGFLGGVWASWRLRRRAA
ncbi:MAG: rhomboid family intramembrane serine protease [Planctomycetota bacterium]|nr:rhomboid family intramembrane serine protease [Planctomycetota bacterium]MCX8039410.1 rhomboid family intramembrane serine protease [Planctomycetota bacterium]MDW8373314.1 rhomboid family intramembrane serine protease [Planctomycetota bacterium]